MVRSALSSRAGGSEGREWVVALGARHVFISCVHTAGQRRARLRAGSQCLALVEQLGTATNSPLHHDHHPVAASGRTRGICANGAPKVGGQAPEQIVPARWNLTAPFAANMSTKHTRLTAPGYQRALFADGSRCGTRASERGPHHWHTRATIRPCRRRTVCFVPAPVRQSKITLTQRLRSGTCQRASTYE